MQLKPEQSDSRCQMHIDSLYNFIYTKYTIYLQYLFIMFKLNYYVA